MSSVLYLSGFVCNDEPVGEMEFSTVEAKELLKQQVRLVTGARRCFRKFS